jgi:hypothetical protein
LCVEAAQELGEAIRNTFLYDSGIQIPELPTDLLLDFRG